MVRFVLSLVLVAFGCTMLYMLGAEESRVMAQCRVDHSQEYCLHALAAH